MAYSGGGLPVAPPAWYAELTPEQHAAMLPPGFSGRASAVKTLQEMDRSRRAPAPAKL